MTQLTDSTGLEADTGTRRTAAENLRGAGAFFFVLAAGFMTVIMLGAAMVPGYEFNAAAISDLGVFPETALLFNVALIIVGGFNIIGGYLFYQQHRSRLLFGGFIVAGIGAIGAGAFTLESAQGLHGISALLAFLFFNIQAIGSGRQIRGVMRYLSIGLGLLGLAFVVVMAVGDGGNAAVFGPIGHGGAERMIVYPPMLWLMVFGGYLMGRGVGEGTDL